MKQPRKSHGFGGWRNSDTDFRSIAQETPQPGVRVVGGWKVSDRGFMVLIRAYDPKDPERGIQDFSVESNKSVNKSGSQDFVELLRNTGTPLSPQELEAHFNELVKKLNSMPILKLVNKQSRLPILKLVQKLSRLPILKLVKEIIRPKRFVYTYLKHR